MSQTSCEGTVRTVIPETSPIPAPSPPPNRRLRLLPLIASGVLLLGCLVVLLLRQLSVNSSAVVALVSMTPYVAVVAIVALALAVLSRSKAVVAAAALVLVLALATQIPVVFRSPAASGGVPVVMMTANLKFGSADAAAVVASVRDHHVDLLSLEELTPEEVVRLKAAGLDEVLPYSYAAPRPTAIGTGLWSRWPLTNPRVIPGFAFIQVTAVVTPPSASAIRVAAVHILAPLPAPAGIWSEELGRLGTELPASDGPILVGGDFNATMDHAQFRSLLATGYSDAVDQSGGGPLRTFPSGAFFPVLVDLDHILSASGVGCDSTQTVLLPGSDHRGLVAVCSVPAA